jgi:hypothetical protein
MKSLALPAYAQLSDADEAALTDLYRRGTPANTLRAWERDLAYIAAWKMASFGRPLDWPEDEKVALRFILDHAQDLTEKPSPAQDVAMELIAIGLRRDLPCPGHAGPPDRQLAGLPPDAKPALALLNTPRAAGTPEGPAGQCTAQGAQISKTGDPRHPRNSSGHLRRQPSRHP